MFVAPLGHLTYCTNIHRGETWDETFQALQHHIPPIRQAIAPHQRFGIGLRLSAQAAVQLSSPATLRSFQHWLDRHESYVFTINGFPYGNFHGTSVKEAVFQPDWTTNERLQYTCRLFDLLVQLLPEGLSGSVSTLPGSFKPALSNLQQIDLIVDHLADCVKHIALLSEKTGRDLHLGLEPEPFGWLETSQEVVDFFQRWREHPRYNPRWDRHLGVTYDSCHQAVEFESPEKVLQTFEKHQIRISKIHLSSALEIKLRPESLEALRAFCDSVYLHQVISRSSSGSLTRYRDLDQAFESLSPGTPPETTWRIHFHLPLHYDGDAIFQTTRPDLQQLLQRTQTQPIACDHWEMETYTWEVLPTPLQSATVDEQLIAEYQWVLNFLSSRLHQPSLL